MTSQENAALARASYEAYVTKDRASLERLLADDFHFTSPLDNRLDRATNRGRDRPEVAKGSKLTDKKPMTYPDPRLTSIGYVLWQLSHTAQLRMTQSLAEINLTLQQLGVLIHLARGDASSTADLARITLTTPQNMSLTVAKLVAAGYVTRRPHEQHGRIHLLGLTPAGARSLRRAVARVTKVEDEMLRGVPASERENLTLSMRQCLARLQAKKQQQR